MKNLIYIGLLTLGSTTLYAQSTTGTYVKTTNYKVETTDGTTKTNTSTALVDDDKIETTMHLDGNGRPLLKVTKQAGGNKEDILVPFVYDRYGRQTRRYLPFAAQNSGTIISNVDQSTLLTDLENYYINRYPEDAFTDANGTTINAYSETRSEFSGLGRVIEQGAPGTDWMIDEDSDTDHTIKFHYDTNTFDSTDATNPNNDNVILFDVEHPNNNLESTSLVYVGHYDADELYKSVVKDENWTSGKNHTTEEFTDKMGRVILKRTFNDNQPHDTYYVYDDFGNLSYVVPPLASDQIVTEDVLDRRINSQITYPWTDLAQVDKKFAEENDKKLEDYKDENTKEADLNAEYNGQGGYTVTTLVESEIVTLSFNFTTVEPIEIKKGEIASLKDYGNFKDSELGHIKTAAYDYIFSIKNNAIVAEGAGKISSLNVTFSSNTKLDYSKDYLWTQYVEIDPNYADDYEKEIKAYAEANNLNPLDVYYANDYGGQGGLNITIDENDIVSVNINSNTTTPLKLKQGLVIPLDIERRIEKRELGEIIGNGYKYTFSISDNALKIVGEGVLTSVSAFLSASPPATTNYSISSEVVDGLCYIYHYDYRNRLVEKKIPGKDWEWIVYDKLDRPVLTQDGNQRLNNIWLATKYDIYGRPIITGTFWKIGYAYERTEIQAVVNAVNVMYETSLNSPSENTASDPSINVYYSNQFFPQIKEFYTITYYDNYDSLSVSEIELANGTTIYDETILENTKTLPTISQVRILDSDNNIINDDWITSVIYFDGKARPIYAGTKNDFLNTVDHVKSDLDFLGKLIEVESSHIKNTTNITTIDNFYYDHSGRLLTQTQTINNNPTELILNYHYDELGQLMNKNVGGEVASNPENSLGLQTIDYAYNIRGWLKSINYDANETDNDLFNFKIGYNNPELVGAMALFNGNISETHWNTVNDNQERNYYYEYDALNRIKNATYSGGTFNFTNNASADAIQEENYSLHNMSYDKNGNILHLERYGIHTAYVGVGNNITSDIVDQLDYFYAPYSNKLENVKDTADNLGSFIPDDNIDNGGFLEEYEGPDNKYAYEDMNGNMTSDKNKGILNIEYNHLNLPTLITFAENNQISYIYDATGTKIAKQVYTNNGLNYTQTFYAGNFIYEKVNSNAEELKFFSHPEGYVEHNLTNNAYNYVYQYKDHLDNIRLSFSDTDGNGSIDISSEIVEENNYYPFGLKHKGYNNVIIGTDHKYGFGGKEEQDELALKWMDFHARNYDAALGRWMNVDALADSKGQISNSPYVYAMNNPIVFTDPDGNCPWGVDCASLAAFLVEAAQYIKDNFIGYDPGGKILQLQKDNLKNDIEAAKNADYVVELGGDVTVGLEAAIKGNIGALKGEGEINFISTEIGSMSFDPTELGSESNDAFKYDYIGQNGEIDIEQKIKIGGEIFGGNAMAGLEAYNNFTLTSDGSVINEDADWGPYFRTTLFEGGKKDTPSAFNSMKLLENPNSSVKITGNTKFVGLDLGLGVAFVLGININLKLGVNVEK